MALSSDPCVAPMTRPEDGRCLSPLLNQEPSHAIGLDWTHSATQLVFGEHLLDARTRGEQDRRSLELLEPKSEEKRQTIHVSTDTRTRSFQITMNK